MCVRLEKIPQDSTPRKGADGWRNIPISLIILVRGCSISANASLQRLCWSGLSFRGNFVSMNDSLGIDSWTEQLFQSLDVCSESVATSFGDAIDGLRLAQHELLSNSHVPGLFELEELCAQVAVRRLSLIAEPNKFSLFHPAEQREQG